MKINSILSENYGEYFGFTTQQVGILLQEYGRETALPAVHDWYDGYLFGNKEFYNPWSMLNYADALADNPDAIPSPYWSNTSSNTIMKELVENSDINVRDEIEQLIAGRTIEKAVHEDIYSSQVNLWNFLFFIGYLKQVSRNLEEDTQYVELAVPNREVNYIYKNTVRSWFNRQLQETISFFDYAENYYHGFFTGILKNMGGYKITSNRESGLGRPDIILPPQCPWKSNNTGTESCTYIPFFTWRI